MHRIAPPLAIAGTLVLTACAVAPPTGPSIAAMPAQGKSLAQFQQDDMACRQYASQQLGMSPAQAAQQSAVNSAAVGTLLGAAAGAALGAAAGNPGAGAAIGAGSGLLVGSAAGASAAQVSGATMQQRYDTGYAQCMYTKGNSVPMTTAGPAGYPPPAYPAYPPPAYYPAPAYYGPAYVGVGVDWGWHRWH